MNYKCELCGFETKKIPLFKEQEYPKNIQHQFKEVK